jgi:hypothetical protein
VAAFKARLRVAIFVFFFKNVTNLLFILNKNLIACKNYQVLLDLTLNQQNLNQNPISFSA